MLVERLLVPSLLLTPHYNSRTPNRYMKHVQDNASAAVRQKLRELVVQRGLKSGEFRCR